MAFIRRAKLGDEKGIHDSHMTSIREVCVKDHGDEIKGWGYRKLDDRWSNSIENNDYRVWVVEDQGNIEGHAALKIKEDFILIIGLYLTPKVIGQGFGAQLMKEMLKEISVLGIKNIRLDSTKTAYNFYKSFGFQDAGDIQCREINGHGVHCYPMSLELT